MKPGMTQTQLLDKLQYIQDNRQDKIVPSNKMVYVKGDVYYNEGHKCILTDHAHIQLASYLGIPLSAMRQFCKDESLYPHWDSIVNTKIEQKGEDKNRLLRITNCKCEGMVSTRFNVGYDAHLTFPTLLEAVKPLGLHLDSGSITDTYSYMKLLSPKTKGTILGQEVQFGLCHSNSDFGLARHRTDLLIFILSCLNGMVVSSVACTVSRTHRGREMWINEDGETDGLPDPIKIREEIEALAASTNDMLNSNRIDKITEHIEEIGKRHIGGESKKIEKYLKSLGLGFEINGIVRHYNQAADYSVWGLSNAITRTAQDVGSYDTSVAMEKAGWSIFNNPPAEYIPSVQLVVEGMLN